MIILNVAKQSYIPNFFPQKNAFFGSYISLACSTFYNHFWSGYSLLNFHFPTIYRFRESHLKTCVWNQFSKDYQDMSDVKYRSLESTQSNSNNIPKTSQK